MTSLRRLVCLAFILTAPAASAQVQPGFGSSLDMIVDPRSLAMGETGAAGVGEHAAWLSNPAVLGGLEGAGADMARRTISNTFALSDLDITSGSVWLGTPIGAFNLHFSHYDLGHSPYLEISGRIIDWAHLYDNTIGLSYGVAVTPAFRAGATIKRIEWSMVSDSSGKNLYTDYYEYGSLPIRVLLDLGAACSFGGLAVREGGDSLHVGLMLENFIGRPNNGLMFAVPRIVRLGAAYDIRSDVGKRDALFRGGVAVEYQHQVQDRANEIRPANFLVAGGELTLFDIVSLRGGARLEPNPGEAGNVRFTYGAGARLAMRRIGVDLPLAISMDYSSRPEFRPREDFRVTTYALALGIAYTAPIFR